ncbi:Zinc finger, CCHC-type [Sesbania bispinosa]|nr:Zinc finger, CCHC-type [Sesbania bispinosa]
MVEITAGYKGYNQGVQQLVGVVAEQQQGNQHKILMASWGLDRFIDGLERLWRALGCSDIRAVELASFQLEGVAYNWFDTVTRGRLVGSPSLAWEQTEGYVSSRVQCPFTQLSRHAPYPITEEMRVKSLSSDKRREREQWPRFSQETNGLRDHRVVIPVLVWDRCPVIRLQQRAVSQRGGSSGQSFGTAQSRRSDQGRSSRTTFPQRHFGVTSTPCPTCGRHHTGACFGDSRVCYQCGQAGHIRRDCPVVVTQPSSSHASAPAALASSQAPSAPVRQLGGSSGRGSGVAQQSGRGSGGRGQAQAGERSSSSFLP